MLAGEVKTEREYLLQLFFQVWLCLGSDNMALPMAGLEDAHDQINQSIQFDQVVSEDKHTQ